MTIRIGLDYDEPIFPWYDYAHDVSVSAGLAAPEDPPPTDWDPTTHYGCEPQAWYDVLDEEVLKGAKGMYARPVKPGVVQAIRTAYALGFEIHILTARGSFGVHGEAIKKLTHSQIIREGIPYTTLSFAKDKQTRALELELDYHLDDRPQYFFDLNEVGIDAWLLNERWNRDVITDKRVDTTAEFLDMIIRRHGTQNKLSRKQKDLLAPAPTPYVPVSSGGWGKSPTP